MAIRVGFFGARLLEEHNNKHRERFVMLNFRFNSSKIGKVGGFTLIEMMIVVAIVAILVAIALPNYLESARRGRRADAQSVLLESAQWMERFYTQNNNYDASVEYLASGLVYSPRGSTAANANYQVILALPGAQSQTFSLTATRLNSMAADDCGNFVLNSVGQRSLVSNTKPDCWPK